LYVLEYRPRHAWILPPLGLLWCNVHGVAYPVMLVLLGSYAAEALVRQFRRRSSTQIITPALSPLIVTMLTVLLTPHGLRLLRVPFTSTAHASHYIRELMPISPYDALGFHFSAMTPSAPTISNVLIFVVGLTWVAACAKRTPRLSHVMLGIAGAGLVFRGARFIVECFLLSLPLIRSHPLWAPAPQRHPQVLRPVYLVGVGLLLLLPLRAIVNGFAEHPAYPFSHRGLPHGVVRFLNTIRVGGTVLNHPNTGGYLQWALDPSYKIFVDMEVPFLFHDEDIYFVRHAFTDPRTLGRLLSAYHPSFVTVPREFDTFPELIKPFPTYVAVFFDDAEVLYVNQDQHPAIAASYGLKVLEPFKLVGEHVDNVLTVADREALMREVHRHVVIDPDCGVTNHIAALVYNDERAYDRTLPFAEAIIANFPEFPVGYRLKADALKGLGAFQAAIAAFRSSMERLVADERPALYKEIGLAQLELGEVRRAYQTLTQSVDLFSTETNREDLYSLARAAQRAGEPQMAKTVLLYLYRFRVDATETQWLEKLRTDLRELGVDDTDAPTQKLAP
jgi:hypothetical protein